MRTLTIRVSNPHAIRLIEELAALQLLEVIDKPSDDRPLKLSERLAGSLTPEQAEQMRRELAESRSGWERNFLIDTNAIIDFSEGRLPSAGQDFLKQLIDNDPYISVITKIELLGFSVVNQAIIDFTDAAVVYGLSEAVVNQTIALRKQYRIKLPDAIIATTALTYGATLISRNNKDFQTISLLTCLDSYGL